MRATKKAKADMLAAIEMTDGMEVPRPWWPVAEALVADGLIELGGARGPDSAWRRAELVPPAHAWVVMGNDFPEAVFSSEDRAEKFVKRMQKDQRVASKKAATAGPSIHWRWYKFEVDLAHE